MTTATRESFIGTWKLLTMVTTHPDGRQTEGYGPNPLGYITYTADGYMHAILMHPNRKALMTPVEEFGRRQGLSRILFILRRLPVLGRAAMALMKSAAYTANWEIRGTEVVHHVNTATLPDWIGIDLVRSYQFEGDRMTLTAHYDDGENIALVWQKV